MKKVLTSLNSTVFLAAMIITALNGTAQAASLSVGDQRIIASQNNTVWAGVSGNENVPYNVSVNPSNPGYAALYPNDNAGNNAAPFEQDITEDIQGWFFTGGANNTLPPASENGGLITMTTTDTAFDIFQQASPQLWIASDPGGDLSSPSTSRDVSPGGYRGIDNVSGSIDISGLLSGTVYFFYGSYSSTPAIVASMKDTDGPESDISMANFHNGDAANRKEMYVAGLKFATDAVYDTIDYDFTSANGRWGGIVVAGMPIPEPSTVILAGLGLMGVTCRRRRQ